MPEAVEELTMYGLCSVGTVARILWIAELRNVASHMDDIFNAEIEQWLRAGV